MQRVGVGAVRVDVRSSRNNTRVPRAERALAIMAMRATSSTDGIELGGRSDRPARVPHRRMIDEDEQDTPPTAQRSSSMSPGLGVRVMQLGPKRASKNGVSLARRRVCFLLLCPVAVFVLLATAMQLAYVLAPTLLPMWLTDTLGQLFGVQTSPPEQPPMPLTPPRPAFPPMPPTPPPPPPPDPSPPPPNPYPRSPPPAPPSPPPRPVVDQINERFRLGLSSDDPNAAGVIVHQFVRG